MKLEEDVFKLVEDIERWFYYAPGEDLFHLYKGNVLMALHKIQDVYQTLSFARISLDSLRAENLGDLIDEDPNGVGKAVIRYMFMNNSISFYNHCIDLSWQVLWLYYNPEMNKYSIHSREDYLKSTKDCTLGELRYPLILAKQEKLYDMIDEFFNRETTSRIRTKYNYIKHRGVYHIDKMGENYKTSKISYDGKHLPLLYREELDLEEMKSFLIEFDKSFVEYFEIIISHVVPMDFRKNKQIELNISEVCKYAEKYFSSLDNKEIK